MAQKKRKIIKRKSLKTFGFFLFFSAIIWLLVQFSKVYTQDISIPLKFVNVPLDKTIKDKPESVDLQMQNRGFSIYYYKFIKPQLKIDLSKAEISGKQLVFNVQDHIGELGDQLKLDFKNSRIIQDEIAVSFQLRKEKMIKVVPKIDINYAVGYSANEAVKLQPDSVKVSGPEEIIDSIAKISTRTIRLTKVNENLSGSIDLDTTDLGMLSYYQTSVKYSQKVEKFTEGRLEIPVEVLNVPPGLNLSYFPKSILIYFQVDLENFDRISAADFKLVCDFSEINDGDSFMIAKIIEKPRIINNYRLGERRVQFVIKR